MRNTDVIVGALLIIISGYIFQESLRFPVTIGHTLGTGFFPRLLAISLFILSMLLIILSLFKGKAITITENDKKFNKNTLFSTFFIFIVSLVYYVVLPKLGFIVTNVAFMLVIMLFLKTKKLALLFLVPFVSSYTIYFIFDYLLQIPLP